MATWAGVLASRSYEHNTITFMANGKHVLLIGEHNVPLTPLICTAELSFLERSNQIEEVYFCYCVSQSAQYDVDDASSCNEPSSVMHSFSLPSQLSLNNVKQPVNAMPLQQLLQEFTDVFLNELVEGLPLKQALPHRIDVALGTKPISKPSYRLSASEAIEVERQLANYLSKGFIRKRFSPWALPILLVKKKDGSMRMCVAIAP